MDDRRAGLMVRRVRVGLRLRQEEVAIAAGISRATVSRVERGDVDGVTLRTLRAISGALQMPPVVTFGWRGADAARLLDEGHADLVERVVAVLTSFEWKPEVEYSFNFYGERGSVDIVAWHSRSRTLLIIEVKTQIVDLQDLFATMHRKQRLVPRLLAAERGWVPEAIGHVLVVPDTSALRSAVRRHAASFASAFPSRTVDVRRWLESPKGDLNGIWFLANSRQVSTTRRRGRSADAPQA